MQAVQLCQFKFCFILNPAALECKQKSTRMSSITTNNRVFFGNASLQDQSTWALLQPNSFYINLNLIVSLRYKVYKTLYCISTTVYFTSGEGLGGDSCMKGYRGMLVRQICKTSKETRYVGVVQLLLDH